jgi:phosphosulfolactate synthase (CoM biosynthesis protein A)
LCRFHLIERDEKKPGWEGGISMEHDTERSFGFLHINERGGKPRRTGVTEIRGPYYSPLGKRALLDIFETMGAYVDVLKFAGGSFVLMPESAVRELIDTCHSHDVLVSTGGFIERVLTMGPEAVDGYLEECKRLGFDIVEVSSGFISVPDDDLVHLVEKVRTLGMLPKPEVGIQFGAGGASSVAELDAEGTSDPSRAIRQAKRYLEAGAHLIMIESEGITEQVKSWRTDVPARFINELGLDKVMFEAADPEVFSWYVKSYGPEVNLFVDHSQIVQLECLRSGIWGTKSTWGRVVTYKGSGKAVRSEVSPVRHITTRPKARGPV